MLPERARPAALPPLNIPGFDLDWRPEKYARDLTEIARFTVPVRTPWVISYAAQRVGRSWRLRAEWFPDHDPRRLSGLTFIDAVISRWHLAAPIDSGVVPLLLRVESAVYPRLRAYYEERLRLWAAHFAALESAPASRRGITARGGPAA